MIKWCLRSACFAQKILLPITVAWSVVLLDFDCQVLALDATSVEISQQRPSLQPAIETLPAEEIRDPEVPQAATVYVETIEVVGSTIFDREKFDPIVSPLQGRAVTVQELQQVARSITQLYLNEGYLTSRALAPTDLTLVENGIARIQIIEGSLEEIDIEGAGRLEGYVRDRIELGAKPPLNFVSLEDQLRLLKADPLVENIEASLRAGSVQGQSILTARVTPANPFVGNVSVDNYSPPSIGAERLGLQLAYRNLSGLGDEIGAAYFPRFRSFDGTYQLEFHYKVPVNPKNGTIELSALIDRSEIVEGVFAPLDIRAESERYSFNFRQPLIRTLEEELAFSFGFAYRDGQTFTFQGPTPFGFGPDANGVSRTSVFELGQEYIRRQVSGAWGLRSALRFGAGILDATQNPAPIPDGRFFSWLAQAQRVQVLDDNNLLIVQGDLQLAANSLLPSEQFAIGGGQSVRGYRQNVRSADNGLRFSIEDRITVARKVTGDAILILAPFFDLGYVWNDPENPNFLPEQQFIAGLGLGLLLQPVRGFTLRLDYAPPLIDLSDRGDDIQDDGFYFSVNYEF